MSTTLVEKRVTELTEADVLEAALDQLSKRDGYHDSYYFRGIHGGNERRPGEHVGATCAIGGVEQAIWRLTGEVISSNQRRAGAYGGKTYERTYVARLYTKVMKRLNDVARSMPAAKEFDTGGCAIEQLTFYRSKRSVLKAFRTALEEASV